jgi:hypothetical protein
MAVDLSVAKGSLTVPAKELGIIQQILTRSRLEQLAFKAITIGGGL